MKKRYVIITLLACALMLIGGVALWLFDDDEPLDYSALEVELGPRDPEVNGFAYLRQVAEEHQLTKEEMSDDPFVEYPGLPKSQIEAKLEENASVMDMVRDAFKREQFQFAEEITYDLKAPELQLVSGMQQQLHLQSRLYILEGENDEALRPLQEGLTAGYRLAQAGGGLLNSVLASGVILLANNEIAYLLAHYDFSREALQDLLHSYQVDQSLARSMQSAMAFEFVFTCINLDHIAQDPLSFLGDGPEPANQRAKMMASLFYKPNATKNWAFRIFKDSHDQLTLPYVQQNHHEWQRLYDSAQSIDHEGYKKYLDRNLMGHATLLMLVPAMKAVFKHTAATTLQNRVTYLYVALALYHLDHGELPPTLDALVPDYIPAVPTDPYDGQPIRYDAQRAILYSVGKDGVDNGGSAFISRFDQHEPNFAVTYVDELIAEMDEDEPTFHIRFNQDPIEAKPASESKHP